MEGLTLGTTADVLGIASVIFSLIAAVFSAYTWWRQRQETNRQKQLVTIVLKAANGTKYNLPYGVRRSQLTRAEIMGRLGMIPKSKQPLPAPEATQKQDQDRFRLTDLNKIAFYQRIDKILDDHGQSTLIIDCTDAELSQFDVVPDRP